MDMHRRSHRLTLVAVAAATLAVSAGCGGGSTSLTPKDAKGELTAATDALGQSDTLTMTLKLGIAPTDIQALARADGRTLSAADAAAITTGQLVVETKTTDGKNLSDKSAPGTKAAIRLLSGNHTYVELRLVGGSLYLQADVRGFLGLIHKQKAYAELRARAATLPRFVQAGVNARRR